MRNTVVITRVSGPCADRKNGMPTLIADARHQHGPEAHVTKTVLFVDGNRDVQ